MLPLVTLVPCRSPGLYHLLDLGDLRLPDYDNSAQEARKRERLAFAWEMLEREVAPPPVKRRVVKVASSQSPPHGGEL